MSEGARVQELIDKSRCCAINEALAKARTYYTPPTRSGILSTPSESDLLESKLKKCAYNYFKPPVVPESVRIARLEQSTLEKEYDPLDPIRRFAEYAPRTSRIPCPPLDPALVNANLPKFARSCLALPNTPLNPTLPV